MKKLYSIKPKSKWAKENVKKFGPVMQLADEKDGHYRFVDATEANTWDFKKWSIWLKENEFEMEAV